MYIVVQRLDQIISLQIIQRDSQREVLIRIGDLLNVPYGEELRRRERERSDRETDKAIADFANSVGAPVPDPNTYRPQRPPKD